MNGINAVKKAKKIIQNDIIQWLLYKGLTVSDAEGIVCELPIIFAVKLENNRWCFVIEEENRRFDKVLVISVDADKTNIIDEYFLFPTQDFTRANFLIFNQNDSLYDASKMEISSVEEIITQFISELLIIKEREEEIKKILKSYKKIV
jgi:hypothetical protein